MNFFILNILNNINFFFKKLHLKQDIEINILNIFCIKLNI